MESAWYKKTPCEFEHGKLQMKAEKSYVCVDLETTGLNPINDRIIEIGAVRVENGKITEKFQTLVDPERPVGSFITSLTGITDEMLFHAPNTSSALEAFAEFSGNSVLVGHNIHCFDIRFLCSEFQFFLHQSFMNDYIDTYRMAKKLFPADHHYKLADLIIKFGIAETEEHRALSDAEQTAACYEVMKQYMTEHGLIHP